MPFTASLCLRGMQSVKHVERWQGLVLHHQLMRRTSAGYRFTPQASLPMVQHVGPPHPDWKPGEKQPAPFENQRRLTLDPAEGAGVMYPFVISAIVPRPIAFISSLSAQVRHAASCMHHHRCTGAGCMFGQSRQHGRPV